MPTPALIAAQPQAQRPLARLADLDLPLLWGMEADLSAQKESSSGATGFTAASSQKMTRADTTVLRLAANIDWWISFWVLPTATGAGYRFIAKNGGTNEYLIYNSASTSIGVLFADMSVLTLTNALSAGYWSKIDVWHDGTNHLLYASVNAGAPVSASSAAATYTGGAGAFTIGAAGSGSANFVDGRMAMVGVAKGYYPTQADRDLVYNNGRGARWASLPAYLQAHFTSWWDLQDAGLSDSVGALTLTASNSPAAAADMAGAAPADGDAVWRLRDLKPAVPTHAVQPTSTKRPVYVADAGDGLPAVRFDGVDDFLQAAYGTQAQPFTFAGVLQFYSGSFLRDNRTGAAANAGLRYISNTSLSLYAGTDRSWTRPVPIGWVTVVGVVNGASSLLYVDGVQVASGASGSNTLDGITLGANNTPGAYSFLAVRAWADYAGAATPAQVARLTAYLRRRWPTPKPGNFPVIHAGWLRQTWTASGTLAGDATYIPGKINLRHRMHGVAVTHVSLSAGTGGSGFKVKQFRANGANYDFVAESALPAVVAGVNGRLALTTPLTPLPGDVLGIYVPAGATLNYTTTTGPTVLSASGDISTTNAFATSQANSHPNAMFHGAAPFVGATGDSYAEGHPDNHGYLHDGFGPAGDVTNEFWDHLYGLDHRYTHLNAALGSQTWAWVASTGIFAAVDSGATAIIAHCGLNDITTSRTTAAMQADILTCLAALKQGQTLFIPEILPYQAGNDTVAAAIRAWNATLPAFCAANGIVLVLCHDALAVTRVSTGQLDNMNPTYLNADNTHLTPTGAGVYAALIQAALVARYG